MTVVNLVTIPFAALLLALPGWIAAADIATPEPEAIRSAVERSLPLLAESAAISMDRRKQCFTCHHQGLPVLAFAAARERGFAVDAARFDSLVDFTAKFLERNRENYLTGKGQGGQALTAGYALWTLERAGSPPSATTAAVAEYLLLWQNDRDHWDVQTIRPPSEESRFAVSYVALRGLQTFATPEQGARVAQRVERVRDWALRTPAVTTEDFVFRLRLLQVAQAPEPEIRRAAEGLVALQRPDGGWGQLPELASDSYATGTALTALRASGGIGPGAPLLARGIAWLLGAQHADGSWQVTTRSTPIQTPYESGYPHGKDQFISATAASWATMALLEALPDEKRGR